MIAAVSKERNRRRGKIERYLILELRPAHANIEKMISYVTWMESKKIKVETRGDVM